MVLEGARGKQRAPLVPPVQGSAPDGAARPSPAYKK
jgi:hypothetical protein